MTLRAKATLIVSSSFLALIGLLLVAAVVAVLARFRDPETAEGHRNADRARDTLNEQVSNLEATTRDSAHWADAAEMAAMLGPLLGEHLALKLVLEPGLSAIRGDVGQLQQVIMNLAVNARDAMPGGGTLTVSTRNAVVSDQEAERLGMPAGSYVLCSVQDTGLGMEEAVRARIFELFFTTKELG